MAHHPGGRRRPPLAHSLVLPVLLLILLSGCGAGPTSTARLPPATVPPDLHAAAEAYWWRCQFKITWAEDKGVNWPMDLLLAHTVVAPVLGNHQQDISYWRFHRRAARDAAGHQFSFLFYSNARTASSVFAEIRGSAALQQALQADLVEKVLTGDPDRPASPAIEDTSDPAWTPEVQRQWPSFIMGVSALWLGLIGEYVDAGPDQPEDIGLLLERYREAEARITATWGNEGQHAFLHHLNAVFGYTPLYLRKMLTF